MKRFRILLIGLFLLFIVANAQETSCPDSKEEDMLVKQGQSTIARWIEEAMRSSNVKKGNRLADYINYLNKTTPARPLNSMYLMFDIDVDDRLGHNIWTLEPPKDMSDHVVIYLHGGSYKYNFVTG
jgi:acetyl esterase/lipase